MMDEKAQFLIYLREELEATGHEVKQTAEQLQVNPLELTLEVHCDPPTYHTNLVTIPLHVRASHKVLFPEGIYEIVVGMGENLADALAYGAGLWVYGSFLTIHELFVHPDQADGRVLRLDMAAEDTETGQKSEWVIYLGPLLQTGAFQQDNLDQTILVQKLLNVITGELHQQKLLWVRGFMAKMPDNSLTGDCWLNNGDWLEGLNALYWFAEEWDKQDVYAALKQFMVIVPSHSPILAANRPGH